MVNLFAFFMVRERCYSARGGPYLGLGSGGGVGQSPISTAEHVPNTSLTHVKRWRFIVLLRLKRYKSCRCAQSTTDRL